MSAQDFSLWIDTLVLAMFSVLYVWVAAINRRLNVLIEALKRDGVGQ